MTTDCIFCKIIAKKIPAKIVYEDEKVIAIKDLNPQAPHHFLIIPREHIATLNDCLPKHNELLGHMFQIAKKIAHDLGVYEEGYRLVTNCNKIAGQSVFHIHTHFLAGRTFTWPPG